MPRTLRPRRGFTLIEMLVVVVLIGMMAGLMLLLYPSINARQVEASAADRVMNWLQIARQQARRDGLPTGVRLWYEFQDATTTKVWVKELEMVQQPADYRGDPVFTDIAPTVPPPGGFVYNPKVVYFEGSDVANGSTVTPLWHVQAGDYFELLGTGLMHRVKTVAFDGAVTKKYALELDTDLPIRVTYTNVPSPYTGTTDYRILRQPRATGDEKLTLPGGEVEGVVIDLSTNLQYGDQLVQGLPTPAPGAKGYVDIVFAPSGAVLMPRVQATTLKLWVRTWGHDEVVDANNTRFFEGEPTILAVRTATGSVGAYPVNRNFTNPYGQIP